MQIVQALNIALYRLQEGGVGGGASHVISCHHTRSYVGSQNIKTNIDVSEV